MITQVRRFNRIVTQRVGALSDHFLARDRSLGESRLLWEIGAEGRDVRSLRAQLQLDSGYLSRLLRGFTTSGLVAGTRSATDRRQSILALTDRGREAFASLDRRSQAEIGALLERLDDVEKEFDHPIVKEIVAFIRAGGKRSLCVPHADA